MTIDIHNFSVIEAEKVLERISLKLDEETIIKLLNADKLRLGERLYEVPRETLINYLLYKTFGIVPVWFERIM